MTNFSGYLHIAIIFFVVEISVIVLTYRRNPRFAIIAILVSMYFKGQYFWIGRAIYAWQFAAVVGIGYMFLIQWRASGTGVERTLSTVRNVLVLYFLFTIFISVPLWLFFSFEELGEIGTSVSLNRVGTQVVFLLFSLGISVFGMLGAYYISALEFLRVLVIIATVAAYGAILQVFVATYFFINIFPILGPDNTLRSAYILDTTFRATSVVGEPKHLGILMATGLVCMFLARLFRARLFRHFGIHAAMAMGVALLLSLSTSGFVLTLAGLGALASVYITRLRTIDLIGIGFVALLLATQIALDDEGFVSLVLSQLSRAYIEVQDESVRLALLDNPLLLVTGTGLGNVHLFAVEFLPDSFPLFRDYGYKANSGLFYVLGDSGIVGLILLAAVPIATFLGYWRLRSYLNAEQEFEGAIVVALLLIAFVLSLIHI